IDQAAGERDPFDVVLLDCHMPEIDGFMVAERVRHDAVLHHATILMLTSGERSDDLRRCRELGLAGYLIKPVTQQELRATVVSVLAAAPRRVPDAPEPAPLLTPASPAAIAPAGDVARPAATRRL